MIATLAFFIIYGGLLLTLCWHDLRYGLLPDKFTCPLLWGGLLYYLCMSPANLQHAVWGAIAGYLAFALIYWLYRGIRGREGIGYGDVKFLAALGGMAGMENFTAARSYSNNSRLRCRNGSDSVRQTQAGITQPAAFRPFPGHSGFAMWLADFF